MHQVTIHEAKTHLSKLIREVLEGEEVIITKGGTYGKAYPGFIRFFKTEGRHS